jgi:hypothetical protein
MRGTVARLRRVNSYKILIGNFEGKRPNGSPGHICEDNIRMELRKIRWDGVDWMLLSQHRDQWRVLVDTVMNLRGL